MIFSVEIIVSWIVFIVRWIDISFLWMKINILVFSQVEIVTTLLSKFKIMSSRLIIFIFMSMLAFKSFIRWNSPLIWTITDLFLIVSNKYKFMITYFVLSWNCVSIFLILILSVNRRITALNKWLAKKFRSINDIKVSLFRHKSCTNPLKVKIPFVVAYWCVLKTNSWNFFFFVWIRLL